MSGSDIEKQMEIFLKQFLLMNVFFPLFITMTVIFFYFQGMGPTFLLGTTLLLLMGYNIIMAKYGLSIWADLRKRKEEKKGAKKAAA